MVGVAAPHRRDVQRDGRGHGEGSPEFLDQLRSRRTARICSGELDLVDQERPPGQQVQGDVDHPSSSGRLEPNRRTPALSATTAVANASARAMHAPPPCGGRRSPDRRWAVSWRAQPPWRPSHVVEKGMPVLMVTRVIARSSSMAIWSRWWYAPRVTGTGGRGAHVRISVRASRKASSPRRESTVTRSSPWSRHGGRLAERAGRPRPSTPRRRRHRGQEQHEVGHPRPDVDRQLPGAGSPASPLDQVDPGVHLLDVVQGHDAGQLLGQAEVEVVRQHHPLEILGHHLGAAPIRVTQTGCGCGPRLGEGAGDHQRHPDRPGPPPTRANTP